MVLLVASSGCLEKGTSDSVSELFPGGSVPRSPDRSDVRLSESFKGRQPNPLTIHPVFDDEHSGEDPEAQVVFISLDFPEEKGKVYDKELGELGTYVGAFKGLFFKNVQYAFEWIVPEGDHIRWQYIPDFKPGGPGIHAVYEKTVRNTFADGTDELQIRIEIRHVPVNPRQK